MPDVCAPFLIVALKNSMTMSALSNEPGAALCCFMPARASASGDVGRVDSVSFTRPIVVVNCANGIESSWPTLLPHANIRPSSVIATV